MANLHVYEQGTTLDYKNEKKFIRYTTKWNFAYRKLFWGNETIY